MSAVELVVEKVRHLSETEAESVLAYLTCLKPFVAPNARELRRMPRAERERILAAQAKEAEAHYRQNPDMILEDVDPPMDYEPSEPR